MACINLRERFGTDYRVSFEPAYDARGKHRRNLDPYMMTLSCRFGVIYPHGGDTPAVEVDYHPKVAKLLAALPGVALHQDGDGEKTFLFPVSLFEAVAAIVRPRRRRRPVPLTEEHKAKLVAAGKQALAERRQKTNTK
jgi:hypothetical protein